MRLKSQFSDVVYQANNVYWQVGKFWTVLWILNELFRIQLRMFKVPDLDPTHFIEAYLEIKKHLKINPKRRIYQLNYLSFSFSLSPKSSGLKIINNFFYLSDLSFLPRIQEKVPDPDPQHWFWTTLSVAIKY